MEMCFPSIFNQLELYWDILLKFMQIHACSVSTKIEDNRYFIWAYKSFTLIQRSKDPKG